MSASTKELGSLRERVEHLEASTRASVDVRRELRAIASAVDRLVDERTALRLLAERSALAAERAERHSRMALAVLREQGASVDDEPTELTKVAT